MGLLFEEEIKGLSPYTGIEPASPSYRPSMLTNYTNGTSYLYWNLYIGYFIPVYNISPQVRWTDIAGITHPAGCAML